MWINGRSLFELSLRIKKKRASFGDTLALRGLSSFHLPVIGSLCNMFDWIFPVIGAWFAVNPHGFQVKKFAGKL